MNVDLEYWVWLSAMYKISPKQKHQLIEYFGDAKSVWNASEKELKEVPFASKTLIEQLSDIKTRNHVDNIMKTIQKENIRVIKLYDENYPVCLKNIYDPPILIYVKGSTMKDEKSIAVVGSRNATKYGCAISKDISYKLSKCGITIVSGMARGIDTKAHAGALEAGGRTIAVLGCGVDIIYPKENERLMDRIVSQGAVISEYIPGTVPMPFNFPARNRLISGISEGVVVIEASEKSGSLITASYALEQGKEVFAVPGNINSRFSTGTNMLIRDGAKVVIDIVDILEELNISVDFHNFEVCEYKNSESINLLDDMDETEKRIVQCLKSGLMHIDLIARRCEMDVYKLNSVILLMEVKGILEQLPGKIYQLKDNI